MRTSVLFFLLVLLCPPLSALADSEPGATESPRHEEPEGRFHFEGRVVYGSTFSNASTETVTNAAGTSAAVGLPGSATSQVDFEAGLISRDERIGAYLDLEINRYAYSLSAVSDGQTGVSLNTKLFLGKGRIRPWLGVGLGVLLISVGGPTSEVVDGVTVSTQNSIASFELTPRIGLDVTLAGPLFLTAQIGVEGSAGFTSATASENGQSESFTVELQRRWWHANGGIGARF